MANGRAPTRARKTRRRARSINDAPARNAGKASGAGTATAGQSDFRMLEVVANHRRVEIAIGIDLGAAKERATTTFHPNGSCRMGPASDRMAVVDDNLRVHGLEGLRVVDASVMPTMLSANLNAATMMIADKASDMILGKAAPEPIVTPE